MNIYGKHRKWSHHGILAHKDDTLPTETQPDLMHLLGADIVDGDDENRIIRFEHTLKLIKVSSLVCVLAPHVFLQLKIGYLRAEKKRMIWISGVDV
jgi:hypothetical protein